MLDTNTMRAVGMMVARMARGRAVEAGVAANEVIELAPLLKEWKPGKHDAGDVTTVMRNGFSGFIARVTKGNDDTSTWEPGKCLQAQEHWEACADL